MSRSGDRSRLVVGAVGSLLLLVVLVRTAWVSDDAFITLRTVHHALEGHGLRFNVAERVQAYTHPLWMLLLLVVHGLTGEPFHGTLALGVLTTMLGVGAVVWHARSAGGLALALALFVSSKAWIDFATSGLENPLTHLFVLAAFLLALQPDRSPRVLALATATWGGAFLTRPDAVLLTGPAITWVLATAPRTRAHAMAALLGGLPVLGWELFSLVYYGALLPNTAFAKLGSGIAISERISQGLTYAWHPVRHDKATLLALASVVPLLVWRRVPAVRALLAGVLLHVLYVVWIGGDFMAGRFWTPVVFAVGLVLARLELPRTAIVGAIAALGLAALQPYAPLRSGRDYARHRVHEGIMDERGFYFQGTGLLSTRPPLDHPYARAGRRARDDGRTAVVRATIGYFGYFAGPSMHVTDPLGLSEPLYARLPAQLNPNWRVGHYRRAPAPGYDPAIGRPPTDPALAALYARVHALTRGPLLQPARWVDGLALQLTDTVDHFRAHRFAALHPLPTERPFQIGMEGVWVPTSGTSMTLQTDKTVHVVAVHADRVVRTLEHPPDGPAIDVAGLDGVAVFPKSRGPTKVRVYRLTIE
jgi:arabinofuranosyltransferase